MNTILIYLLFMIILIEGLIIAMQTIRQKRAKLVIEKLKEADAERFKQIMEAE